MKRIFLPVIFFVLIFPVLFGLLHPGLFVSDDGGWMVIRFSAFYDALKYGQFPVRFLPRLNQGYGYPVADFLYPLFLYLGVPFKIIKIGFIDTVKVIFALGIITSGVFTYYWLRRILGRLAAFCAALMYILFPYHIWDMYVRGSIGEILGIAIFPFILWQVEESNWPLSALGIGFLILAHNSLALLFLPVLALYLWTRKLFTFKKVFLLFLSGFGIAAFFWVPALYDTQFTVFDKTPVADTLQYLSWQYPWQLLGLISVGAFFCILWHFYRQVNDKTFILFTFIIVLIFVLTIPPASFLWKFLPVKQFIQFPFRLYSLAIPAVVYIFAKTIQQLNIKFPVVIMAIFLSYISSISFIFPKNYWLQPDSYYFTNLDTTTVHNEYMPVWVKTRNLEPRTKNELIVRGNAQIINETTRGTNVKFDIKGITSTIVQINFVYFPGWQVYIDGKQVGVDYTNSQGLIRAAVPLGNHAVMAKFGETNVRLVSDLISIMFLIVIILYSLNIIL